MTSPSQTPPALSLAELTAAFLAQPQVVVEELMATRQLKGNPLSGLRKAILENPSRADLAPFLWLLFSPRFLSIILTQGHCNLSCRMCGGARGKLRTLAPSDLLAILHHVPTAELATFVAGDSEPLLHPKLADLFGILRDFRVHADIVTNGQLLTESLMDRMVDLALPTSLNISLDAATETTYRLIRGASLNSALRNLRYLHRRKQTCGGEYPRLALLMVGMADNISELPSFVDLAAEVGAFRVHVDHMKGDYSPGDFTTHPDWPQYAAAAQERARATGVLLQLPSDIRLENASDPAKGEATLVRTRQPTIPYCSWIDSVYIGLNGAMMPCCHHGRALGNLMERHISDQTRYFQYRMKNLEGRVEAFCMATRNCAYTEEQSSLGLKPALMEATGI